MATMQEQNVSVCDKTVKKSQNGTQATINNQTHSLMTLHRSHNWSGSPDVGHFPTTISPNDHAIFTHWNGNSFGSKAAVVYTGKNAANVDCAWVVAWHAPADNTFPNRAFVACETKQIIDDNLDFEKIQEYLDKGLTYSNSASLRAKIIVHANVKDTDPNYATLVSNIGLLP
ncbi:jasmonate-induced protein homolog [Silene latifolia]|uniref:jasmonate-induced protein homolog n=1 Tax=Silene latifolia TaxID=37657 RepID=UPI003D787516